MKHFKIGLLFLTLTASFVFAQDRLDFSRIRNPKVRYVAPEKLKIFPMPVIGYEAPGLASDATRNAILRDVVYPVINNSGEPIAAVILKFFEENKNQFAVSVYWHNGRFSSVLLTKNKNGAIDKNAYRDIIAIPEHSDE